MSPSLFLIFWITALTSILSGAYFVHSEYTKAIEEDIREFEQQWRELEDSKNNL